MARLDPSDVDEQRNFPHADCAQVNGSPVLPAAVDQSARRGPQLIVAAIEPEGDMGVEQKRLEARR
jgi:hypothetical protein